MRFYKWLLDRSDKVFCIGFIFAIAPASLSFADTIILKGSDVIHGRIIEQDENGVLLEHEDLGQIRIDSARITSVLVNPNDPNEIMPADDQSETESGPPAPSHLVKEPEFDWLKVFSARAKDKG